MVLDRLLGQEVGELLLRGAGEHRGGPEFGGEVGVGLGQGVVHSHGQVTTGAGVAGGGGVDVLDTGHVEQLLGDEGSHNAGPTGSGDQTDTDGPRLAGHLARHGVGFSGVEPPVATADGDQVLLGVDDTTTDGRGDFLGGLDAQPDVAITVTDSHIALEAGALTSRRLLLHGHDLHDLVPQTRTNQEIHNLVFLDGQREKEDLLNGLDLALLYQATELGARNPLVLVTTYLFSMNGDIEIK